MCTIARPLMPVRSKYRSSPTRALSNCSVIACPSEYVPETRCGVEVCSMMPSPELMGPVITSPPQPKATKQNAVARTLPVFFMTSPPFLTTREGLAGAMPTGYPPDFNHLGVKRLNGDLKFEQNWRTKDSRSPFSCTAGKFFDVTSGNPFVQDLYKPFQHGPICTERCLSSPNHVLPTTGQAT